MNEIAFTAGQILAQNSKAMNGEGMHKSPRLVADALDLAEMLHSEIEKRDGRPNEQVKLVREALEKESADHQKTLAAFAQCRDALAKSEAALADALVKAAAPVAGDVEAPVVVAPTRSPKAHR